MNASVTFTTSQIRSDFLEFFKGKGHTIVPSAPLVPGNDPTLLFTNSGMVQFKDVFLGAEKRSYVRAADVQRCLRAGGKHNDLDQVGYTARHHTFFEMLGNWSFGDYFKKDAIAWAWELLTQVWKLPADRLLVTVYQTDDEAYALWRDMIGIPEARIVRIGDNKGAPFASDNFWQMAETGPCGPCTEIFYDHGDHIAGGPPGSPDEDGDRFIEIWNLVFMQFDRQPDGTLVPLPAPCVDTGMGLERLAAILQHVHTNYEIDLFQALIRKASELTGMADLENKSLRVIADHIRACSFLIVDGVLPSNEGRGYVLRRIIRRALRHGWMLGVRQPFFSKLVPTLVEQMGVAYPELPARADTVVRALQAEEERFAETLDSGMKIFDDVAAKVSDGVIPGVDAFRLYDTYGFPVDLTADIARERDMTVDMDGFNAAMENQRETARAAGKFGGGVTLSADLVATLKPTVFLGYDRLQADGLTVLAVLKDGRPVEAAQAGDEVIVITDQTPFYAESGGQVGDTGELAGAGGQVQVTDTQKFAGQFHGHVGTITQGSLKVGDVLRGQVDGERRGATILNHSATHLLHAALREVLGTHVQQKGSLVDPDKTRFDFAHNAPVTSAQILEIEQRVNAEILQNEANVIRVMPIEEAQKSGAMMLFGEKYGETVRVIDIGSSRELCGGTHVRRTGDIGLFKVTSEGGVAAGVRRIEAVTGANALHYLQDLESTVQSVASTLRAPTAELQARLGQVLDQMKGLEREIGALKGKLAASKGDELVSQAIDLGGVQLLVARLDGGDARTLRDTMDKLKDKLKSAVVVLALVEGAKVQLAAGATGAALGRVKAGELVNFVAQQVGGKGGGKPDMAMAGGTDATALPGALASVRAWVQERL